MYFALQAARRLSVVEVEQFREARQVLGYVDLLGAGNIGSLAGIVPKDIWMLEHGGTDPSDTVDVIRSKKV